MDDPVEEFIIRPVKYAWLVLAGLWWRFRGWNMAFRLIFSFIFLVFSLSVIFALSLMGVFPDWVKPSLMDFLSEYRTTINNISLGFCFSVLIFPFLFLYEASKIHDKQEKLASRYSWEHVDFNPNSIGDMENQIHTIDIKNGKPFDITNVYIDILNLEVDGEVKYKRLTSWIGDEPRFSRFPRYDQRNYEWNTFSLIKEIGEKSISFFRKIKRSDKYVFQILKYTPSDASNIFEQDFIEFQSGARGDMVFIGKIDNVLIPEECIYSFTIKIKNDEPEIHVKKGKLPSYS